MLVPLLSTDVKNLSIKEDTLDHNQRLSSILSFEGHYVTFLKKTMRDPLQVQGFLPNGGLLESLGACRGES